MTIEYVPIIAMLYPNVECYSEGDLYEDIVHTGGDAIPTQAQLDLSYFTWYKNVKIEECNRQANSIQLEAQGLVTGTTESIQVRVYEQKFRKAYVYKQQLDAGANPDVPVMLQKEVEQTGDTITDIVGRILSNGALTWSILDPILGKIEGCRRKYNKSVKDAPNDIAVIDAIELPPLPDVQAVIQQHMS